MAIQQDNTALLLFTRSGEEESLTKKFLPFGGIAKNRALTQKIIDRSVQLGESSGLPFFVWDQKLQYGSTFGERLANAVTDVFKKGFEKIIVIGNDCLTLNPGHIHQAAVALHAHDYVLAPTRKGGAYLIGLTQRNFNYQAFTSIRWQSSFTNNDLVKLFSTSLFQLPVQDDVNNFYDLRLQAPQLMPADALRMYVVSIIKSMQEYSLSFTNRIASFIFRFLFGLKAPPVFSFLP